MTDEAMIKANSRHVGVSPIFHGGPDSYVYAELSIDLFP